MAAVDRPIAVRFEGVSVVRDGVSLLEDITATVPRGSCTAIIGPNGAGKTTLLLALLGEIGYRGRIRWDSGKTPSRIGYVPQRLTFDRAMPLTVDEFLAMGFQRKPLWFGVRADLRRRAQEYLAMVKAALAAGSWRALA